MFSWENMYACYETPSNGEIIYPKQDPGYASDVVYVFITGSMGRGKCTHLFPSITSNTKHESYLTLTMQHIWLLSGCISDSSSDLTSDFHDVYEQKRL